MRLYSKTFKIVLISMLLFFSLAPPLTSFAVEDSILGVSIDKFNGVMSARNALEVTKDEYQTYGDNPGFAQKLRVDTLHYKLEILKIAQELGSNYTPLIPEHIKAYNSLLIPPLTDDYEILAEVDEDAGTYTINSSVEMTLNELQNIIGASDNNPDTIDLDSTIWAQLNKLEDATDSFADNKDGLKEYYTENISSIRYLMTAIKDIYSKFSNDTQLGDDLKDKFIEVYDAIASFALENDLQALANLNLFGDTISFDITAEGEELLDYVAEWNELPEERLNNWASGNKVDTSLPTEMFKEYSEYMLKNIAVSSTFKPFETNLNTVEPFSFLGDESKVFHEMFGTKRKLLLSPKEGDNTLNIGMNLEMVQNLKIMTLRDFIENPDGNKIIYVDNLQYTLKDIEKVQEVMTGEVQDAEADGSDNEDLNDIAETTQEESGNTEKGWLASAWSWVNNSIGNQLRGDKLGSPSLFFEMYNNTANLMSDGKSASTLLFAKGDVENLYNLEQHVMDHASKITMSNLIYNNIREEYWTYGSKLKLSKDMDKPMFVDIYGNILTASGIVVIPAMTNPYLNNKSDGVLLFTRAFIESYPTYTVDKGDLKVKHSDRKKLALFGYQKTEDEIEYDIKHSSFDYKDDLTGLDSDGEVVENTIDEEPDDSSVEGEISDTLVSAFVEQEMKYIPGVKFFVGKADSGELGMYPHATRNITPIAYKFDNEYEPVKSLDLFSFAKKSDGSSIDSYYAIRESLGQVSGLNKALLINEYTVKLSFDEGSSHTVTFKDFPDSDEIKRYMYLVNLEHLAKVEDGQLIEKHSLSDIAKITTTEALFKGVADTAMLNSLVPEFVETMFTTIKNLNIEKANDRYNNALRGDVDNNIVYIKNIEEVDSVKSVLPTIYKAILVLSIAMVILNLVLYAISKDGRFSRIIKVLVILYVVTFLFIVMPKAFTTLVNSPMKAIFKDELMHWTLIEQEKQSNTSIVENNGQISVSEDTFSSSIKLHEVKYSSPFSIFRKDDYMNIDEFYSLYVNNDSVFESQSTPMYMDGRFLTVDTETIFNSSSIVVEDKKDPLMKVRHDIYGKPEFSYYLPYYMIVDNLVYNINAITEVTKKVPRDIVYSNGDRKTSGRISDWINSSLFLDYEDFLERVTSFEAGDKISSELAVADIEDMLSKYGNPYDFLGLGKILGQPTVLTLGDGEQENLVPDSSEDIVVNTEISEDEEALAPFTTEGLAKIQNTGWYPNNFDKEKNPYYQKLFEEKIQKVNDKTKRFMLELGDISRNVADEHLIKTIALYASIEFNKEFNSFATNKGPTGIELNNVPIERLMMSLTLPREELIDNSITTYPNQLINNAGYIGLTIGVFNDFLIIFINSLKPIIIVLMWAVIGMVIFIKKILLPDVNNKSIMGSIKLLILFILFTLAYSIWLVGTIKIVNWLGWSLSGVLLTLVANLAYSIGLIYLAFVMVKDLWDLGSNMTLGVLDRAIQKTKMTFRNAFSLVPFADRIVPGLNDSGGRVKPERDYSGARRPVNFPTTLPTGREIPEARTSNSSADVYDKPVSDNPNDYYVSPSLKEVNETGRSSKPIVLSSESVPNPTQQGSSNSLNDSSLTGGTARTPVGAVNSRINDASEKPSKEESRPTPPVDLDNKLKTEPSNKNKEE